jgi:hypothetical protein
MNPIQKRNQIVELIGQLATDRAISPRERVDHLIKVRSALSNTLDDFFRDLMNFIDQHTRKGEPHGYAGPR